MCLAIAGVANQSETKNHISYCVTTKSQIIHTHMGTHEHHPISSSHTYFCLARFIVNITHQHDNDRTLKAIYCACYFVGFLVYNYIKASWN